MDAAKQPVDSPQSSIAGALTRLEQRADSAASGWRLLMYAIILSPLAFVAPMLFGQEAPLRMFGAGARVGLALTILCVWYGLSLRRSVRRRLDDSELAASIALGNLPASELSESMPWPWSRLVRDDSRLEPTLMRVAGNLDWYLSAERRRQKGLGPGRLFRPAWIYLPLALGASLSMLFPLGTLLYWRLAGPVGISSFSLIAVVLGVLSPLFPLPFLYYRRQVWTQELARHLRERLEIDGEG